MRDESFGQEARKFFRRNALDAAKDAGLEEAIAAAKAVTPQAAKLALKQRGAMKPEVVAAYESVIAEAESEGKDAAASSGGNAFLRAGSEKEHQRYYNPLTDADLISVKDYITECDNCGKKV